MAATTSLTGAKAAGVLPVEDYGRAKAFWEEKAGFPVQDMDQEGVGMLQAGEGTQVLLYTRERTRAEHTALAFNVSDIEATVDDLRGRGVTFEEYDMPGIKTENGIAWMGSTGSAWFVDTEGNIISLNQM
jgi:predicted enzyme related to lactoylglutathione lyase